MEAARWVSWLLRFVSAGSGTLGTNARWQRPRLTPRTPGKEPRMTRTRAVLAGAVLTLVALVGCGGGNTEPGALRTPLALV